MTVKQCSRRLLAAAPPPSVWSRPFLCYTSAAMRRVRRMRFGMVLLSMVLTAVLTPLAYASPPDPSWIAGIYDNDDYDNVVSFVTSSNGAIEAVALAKARPLLPVGGWVSALESDWTPGSPGFSSHSRAPPAS